MLQFKNLSLVCLLFFSQVHTSEDQSNNVIFGVGCMGLSILCGLYNYYYQYRYNFFQSKISDFKQEIDEIDFKIKNYNHSIDGNLDDLKKARTHHQESLDFYSEKINVYGQWYVYKKNAIYGLSILSFGIGSLIFFKNNTETEAFKN